MAARVAIPGLKDAIAQQDFVRDAAFALDIDNIAGIEVRALTLRHLCILKAAGNPLICGGVPEAVHVAAFMWVVSPGYNPRARVRRWFFVLGISRRGYMATLAGAEKYLAETFQDTQGCGGDGPNYYSVAASLVGLLASEYGWGEADILSLPIKRVLQYANEIRRRRNPEAPIFNPSDRCLQRWLDGQQSTIKN